MSLRALWWVERLVLTMLIWTKFSMYEVHKDKRLVARRQSGSPPTDRTGSGDWRPYMEIQVEVGFPAVFLWDITVDGVWQMTKTSPVVAIEIKEMPDV